MAAKNDLQGVFKRHLHESVAVFPFSCQANFKLTFEMVQNKKWELAPFPSAGLERFS